MFDEGGEIFMTERAILYVNDSRSYWEGELFRVEKVAFDRSGFQYHGRVAALAESAREAGLKF